MCRGICPGRTDQPELLTCLIDRDRMRERGLSWAPLRERVSSLRLHADFDKSWVGREHGDAGPCHGRWPLCQMRAHSPLAPGAG